LRFSHYRKEYSNGTKLSAKVRQQIPTPANCDRNSQVCYRFRSDRGDVAAKTKEGKLVCTEDEVGTEERPENTFTQRNDSLNKVGVTQRGECKRGRTDDIHGIQEARFRAK